MGLSPRVLNFARRLLPSWVQEALDPVETRIRRSVSTFAASLPSDALVLDAGCGEGRFRPLFQHQRLIGVDMAVGDPAWNYDSLDAICDLHALPFPNGSMDAALCIVVLEHVKEPGRVLSELARVLKPGGRLLLVLPLLWEVHQAPHDFFRFTRYGAAHLLESAGFSPLQMAPLGGFFAVAARRCVNSLNFFQGGWRWPLFFLLAPLLGLALPLFFRTLDGLDRQKDFTLGYDILAIRR